MPGGLDTSEEEALTALVTYFDETYVRGTTRRTANGVNRIISPLVPPGTWNVYQATLNDDRTNNFCESWNKASVGIVGHNHPTVWAAIEAFQKDNVLAHTTIQKNNLGERPKNVYGKQLAN